MLFRRKPADVVEAEETPSEESAESRPQVRGYTPPKGQKTPKRSPSQVRRPPAPPPANRREAYKQSRERQRAQRAEALEGMRRGDPQYLPARDRGEERALVRDIVDSRRTMGTWFFGGALLVIIGSSRAMPPEVQLASNALWITLALAVVVDSVLIARKIKRLVRARYPQSGERMRSLYLYGIMRAMTFRRMRIPKPRVTIGKQV